MGKKYFGAIFLMMGGAAGAFAVLLEQPLWWLVTFIFALVGCIAIGFFDKGVE
jgi:hypothetical protein